MTRFFEICKADIEWRTREIALLKKATVSLSISTEMRKIILKYSIPALYALWEGFVTFIFSEYVRAINLENIPARKIDIRILTYHSFSTFNLQEPPSVAPKREDLTKRLLEHFDKVVALSADISTGSNVDYKSLSGLMNRYGIEAFPEAAYKSRLAKFLSFRNKIAHGSNSLTVDADDLSEFSSLITELMDKLTEKLDVCICQKGFLKS